MSGEEWCHFWGCSELAEPWNGLLTDEDPGVPMCIGHQTRVQQVQRGHAPSLQLVRQRDGDGHTTLLTRSN